MRICQMFNPEQELNLAKFMDLATETYQLAFNALEASNELFLTEPVSCRDEFHMELVSIRDKFRERLFTSLVSK
jgi:hypothetical protein